MEIKPQPGPQEAFLSTPADIAIYGGAAGGGKSWGLLMEPLRHMDVPGFTSVIFRRTYPEFENEGGLWDDSEKLYPYAGGIPKESALSWQFPSPGCNNVIKFSHMEHEKSKLNYQGSQICFLGFDELTHFTESQFTYMLSRNRSTCGVKPYIRATCNPDADSWVSRWVAWYIGEDGYPIPERSGVIRYFVRVGDNLYWGNTQGGLWEHVQGLLPAEDFQPKSFTFIPARLDDNPALIAKDPSYRANLLALNMVDRLRLLGGNWKIRPAAGTMFRVEWFRFIDPQELPSLATLHLVRAWDTAATEPTSGNPNPDWTAGVLMGEYKGQYYIIDLVHIRKSPAGVEAAMGAAAELDGRAVDILMEQEPGSASKREADRFKRGLFAGYSFRAETTSGKGNKIIRAKPLSSAVENGLVYLVRGAWNYTLIGELVNFPDPAYHDDIVDAASGAFEYLSRRAGRKGAIDLSGMLQQKGSFLGI